MAVLTYCTNIHPAETWDDTFANIRHHVPEIKKLVSPHAPFPVGLRLSGRAADEADAEAAARFLDWCQRNDCFVSTMNGFPYGTFHHVPIKEQVYQPDWRHSERLRYTGRLAELLAFWMPEGMRGSISTVPLGFKECITPEEFPLARSNLLAALEFFDRIAQKSGRQIVLSLEPEPGCLLETTGDVVACFDRLALPANLRPYLAVCYDCCHQALQFESPGRSLQMLADNEIKIGHVQVSSALRMEGPGLTALQRFCEPCYLHQTVGRGSDGTLVRYLDLDRAIAAGHDDVLEWRIHFHIPVFINELTDCATTQPFLAEILPLFGPEIPLEVETYTWTVLPPDLRTQTVTESIARELEWVKRRT